MMLVDRPVVPAGDIMAGTAAHDKDGVRAKRARAFGGGHQHAYAAVGVAGAVEAAERVGDHRRCLVILQRDRLAVLRQGVQRRVVAVLDGDGRELFALAPWEGSAFQALQSRRPYQTRKARISATPGQPASSHVSR